MGDLIAKSLIAKILIVEYLIVSSRTMQLAPDSRFSSWFGGGVRAGQGVAAGQVHKWRSLLAILPPLPMAAMSNTRNTSGGPVREIFSAAQQPYPPHAVLGGSEQPYMYAARVLDLGSCTHARRVAI